MIKGICETAFLFSLLWAVHFLLIYKSSIESLITNQKLCSKFLIVAKPILHFLIPIFLSRSTAVCPFSKFKFTQSPFKLFFCSDKTLKPIPDMLVAKNDMPSNWHQYCHRCLIWPFASAIQYAHAFLLIDSKAKVTVFTT